MIYFLRELFIQLILEWVKMPFLINQHIWLILENEVKTLAYGHKGFNWIYSFLFCIISIKYQVMNNILELALPYFNNNFESALPYFKPSRISSSRFIHACHSLTTLQHGAFKPSTWVMLVIQWLRLYRQSLTR